LSNAAAFDCCIRFSVTVAPPRDACYYSGASGFGLPRAARLRSGGDIAPVGEAVTASCGGGSLWLIDKGRGMANIPATDLPTIGEGLVGTEPKC